jgi:hypothetical protein
LFLIAGTSMSYWRSSYAGHRLANLGVGQPGRQAPSQGSEERVAAPARQASGGEDHDIELGVRLVDGDDVGGEVVVGRLGVAVAERGGILIWIAHRVGLLLLLT